MKKAFVVSLAIVLCVAAIAVAESQSFQGTVTRLDTTQKMMVLKDSGGNETTFYWNNSTRISGDLREGATVQLSAQDNSGTLTATSIQIKSVAKNPQSDTPKSE